MVNQILLRQQQIPVGVMENIEHMALPSGVNPLPIAPRLSLVLVTHIQMRYWPDFVKELPIGEKSAKQKKPRPENRVAAVHQGHCQHSKICQQQPNG
jgi:hypothetical protein